MESVYKASQSGKPVNNFSQSHAKQYHKYVPGTRITIDHDSSAQTLDDSRISHADNFRSNFLLDHNSHQQPNQPILEQVYSTSLEREQEIIRLQRKMCKLQTKIGKLQKRAMQLQSQ